MYSEEDINSAVEAGALSEDAAASFRAHMSEVRGISRGDEENFRLLNSFNDIFVTIGIAIMLFAMGAIGQQLGAMLEGVGELSKASMLGPQPAYGPDDPGLPAALAAGLVALASWPLAEFFTRQRRMALPSLVLLMAFVGGVFVGSFALGISFVSPWEAEALTGYFMAGAGMIAALAAWLHWLRFKVPITVAAGSAALVATLIGLVLSVLLLLNGDHGQVDRWEVVLGLTFVAGLAVFAFAMRWDLSDPARTTRRSDVAFWLHLLAAPMIAHPIFATLGVMGGSEIGVGKAIAVLAIYVVFGLVALIVDRRALLVSALVYVLVALAFLFDRFGAVELTVALTALVIGSALLTLSAFWAPIRRGVLGIVPEYWRHALPSSDRVMVAA